MLESSVKKAKLSMMTAINRFNMRNEHKKTNETKYTYAIGVPQSSSSSMITAGMFLSHLAPDVHASIILGQFSPVATLLFGLFIYWLMSVEFDEIMKKLIIKLLFTVNHYKYNSTDDN